MNYIKSVCCAAVLVLSVACTDWLQVDPYDKILERQLFSTEQGVQVALSGLYLNMADQNLYGRDLTNRMVEALASRYYYATGDLSSSKAKIRDYFANYQYSDDVVKNELENVWRKAYTVVLNINNFIDVLQRSDGVMSEARRNLCLGEAYGLRAFIYVDLMRLFGPADATSSTDLAIPYYTLPEAVPQERKTADSVMARIFADLNLSLTLLADDPVKTNGAAGEKDSEFWSKRQWRMNYYAVQTLKLRALMMCRNNPKYYTEAYMLAKKLVGELDGNATLFPWGTRDKMTAFNSEDYVLSSEVMFGIYVSDMYTIYERDFSSSVASTATLLATSVANLKVNFDAGGTISESPDWRAQQWVGYPQDGTYMVCRKFKQSANKTDVWYYQPLIRKSEVYYAYAELATDMQFVDVVRQHRGLKKVSEAKPTENVGDPAVIDREIRNEYQREFFGEGQLFFYYKRKQLTEIQNGADPSKPLAFDLTKYVLPIPQKELDY